MIIGIEGPAGSGKSTMARTVAAEIGATIVEGGAWYRALTYVALQNRISAQDTEKLVQAATQLDLDITTEQDGRSKLSLGGQDVTKELYGEAISTAIAPIAQNLQVREAIEPKITGFVRSKDPVIIVGRHIHRVLPEAAVLKLTIDEEEADRRHELRAGAAAQSVKDRNDMDKITAHLLGNTPQGETVVDVTNMTPDEQAEVLRQFIAMQR